MPPKKKPKLSVDISVDDITSDDITSDDITSDDTSMDSFDLTYNFLMFYFS